MTTALSELTSIRVGGAPAEIFTAHTRDDLVEHTLEVWRTGENWLLLSGGSNMVVADDISDYQVIRVANRGIEKVSVGNGRVVLRVQAGENWDSLVAQTVEWGLAGIEAMSGIPGLVGAGPVQNIGAYGQELSDTLLRIEFLDYRTEEIGVIEAKDLEFGYRTSAIKRDRPGVVTWIELELLDDGGLSRPLYSTQIAADLGVEVGAQVPLADVRASVLKLRSQKGMVLDSNDPNSVSCGSFFTNPIVTDVFARSLPFDAPKWEDQDDEGLTVKLSAAWLIEQSGINKGFSLAGSGAAISSKHTLAIVNRGNALVPEPNLIGF
jgi:UDP-N-acetylmuramate dehydrogenase